VGFTTPGYIPRREFKKVTCDRNNNSEQLEDFLNIVAECGNDKCYVDMWELLRDLQMYGLHSYVDVVAKIHGEIDRPQYVKDLYMEQLEKVTKYMK
jgi:hypothetical protein